MIPRPRAIRMLLALLLGLGLAAGAAQAQRAVSLQDAVEKVQRETGGKILSAQTVKVGKTKLYRVKVLLPDGRVRVVQVPGAGR
ncbi:MAG TPA: hypothetical protein PLI00_10215 [Pseudomonadota bacterium]|nr:PepSY domain-containing protein [Xanthomonadales bacterium]HQY36945.1 hypothetical protein [Pseudomonadota bacterium]